MKPILVGKRNPKTGMVDESQTGYLMESSVTLVPRAEADGSNKFFLKPLVMVLWNDELATIEYLDPGSIGWLEILNDSDFEDTDDDDDGSEVDLEEPQEVIEPEIVKAGDE